MDEGVSNGTKTSEIGPDPYEAPFGTFTILSFLHTFCRQNISLCDKSKIPETKRKHQYNNFVRQKWQCLRQNGSV